jgi:hypothetical protein
MAISKTKELSARIRLAAAELDPATQGDIRRDLIGIADMVRSAQMAPGMGMATMGDDMDLGMMGMGQSQPGGGGMDFAEMGGQEKSEPGPYSIDRDPDVPIYDFTILRINAGSPKKALGVAQEVVEFLKGKGHDLVAVGSVTDSKSFPQAKKA